MKIKYVENFCVTDIFLWIAIPAITLPVIPIQHSVGCGRTHKLNLASSYLSPAKNHVNHVKPATRTF